MGTAVAAGTVAVGTEVGAAGALGEAGFEVGATFAGEALAGVGVPRTVGACVGANVGTGVEVCTMTPVVPVGRATGMPLVALGVGTGELAEPELGCGVPGVMPTARAGAVPEPITSTARSATTRTQTMDRKATSVQGIGFAAPTLRYRRLFVKPTG